MDFSDFGSGVHHFWMWVKCVGEKVYIRCVFIVKIAMEGDENKIVMEALTKQDKLVG